MLTKLHVLVPKLGIWSCNITRRSISKKVILGGRTKKIGSYPSLSGLVGPFRRHTQTQGQVPTVNVTKDLPLLVSEANPLQIPIKGQEYIDRRNTFLGLIKQSDTSGKLNHLVILPACGTQRTNLKHNEMDMFYLTGITDTKACLVILLTQTMCKTILFQDRIDTKSIQEAKFNVQKLTNEYGIDEIYPFKSLLSYLEAILQNEQIDKMWYDTRNNNYEIRRMMGKLSSLSTNTEFENPLPYLSKLRVPISPTVDNSSKAIKKPKETKVPNEKVIALEKKKEAKDAKLRVEQVIQQMKLIPDPIPGTRAREFVDRRNKLLEMIVEADYPKNVEVNHIVVLPSSGNVQGAASDSNLDMIYLTGIIDPQSCLVLLNTAEGKKSVLFHDPLTTISLIGGKINSQYSGGLGIDAILPFNKLFSYLDKMLQKNSLNKLWYDTQNKNMEIRKIMGHLRSLPGVSGYESPMPHLKRMRLVKSEAELKSIRKTCYILSNAFNYVMSKIKPGMSIGKLETLIHHKCENLAGGSSSKSAPNRENSELTSSHKMTKEGDLIIVNAGYNVFGYGAEITRTWPVMGKFTNNQRVVYNVLYRTQQRLIIGMLKHTTFDQMYDKLCEYLSKELFEIKFFKDNSLDTAIKNVTSVLKPPIGNFMDAECSMDKSLRNTPLVPGMVVSIGPAMYVGRHRKDVSAQFRGLEITIKDVILITNTSPEILTERCLRSPFEVEAKFSHMS